MRFATLARNDKSPMPHGSVTETIPAPSSEVFRLLHDYDRRLEWDTLLSRPDTRREYGESRQIGYAIAGRRLYCVVFVDRAGDVRRIISLRKANSREVASYARNA